jgi:hypothetical protein
VELAIWNSQTVKGRVFIATGGPIITFPHQNVETFLEVAIADISQGESKTKDHWLVQLGDHQSMSGEVSK